MQKFQGNSRKTESSVVWCLTKNNAEQKRGSKSELTETFIPKDHKWNVFKTEFGVLRY